MAVANAIGMTFGDAKMITFETLSGRSDKEAFSRVAIDDRSVLVKKPLEGFPYDVTYQNEASLRAIYSSTGVWSYERIEAHRGKYGIEAKRCSVSENLWAKWSAIHRPSYEITQPVLDMLRKKDIDVPALTSLLGRSLLSEKDIAVLVNPEQKDVVLKYAKVLPLNTVSLQTVEIWAELEYLHKLIQPQTGDIDLAKVPCYTVDDNSIATLRGNDIPEALIKSMIAIKEQRYKGIDSYVKAIEKDCGLALTKDQRNTVFKYATRVRKDSPQSIVSHRLGEPLIQEITKTIHNLTQEEKKSLDRDLR